MIVDLISVFLLSVFISFFVKFIDFCFNEGNIFDWYYKYILDSFETTKPKLFKVLGGCIFCFGTWIFIINYILISIYSGLPIIYIFIGMGINFISLLVLERNFD